MRRRFLLLVVVFACVLAACGPAGQAPVPITGKDATDQPTEAYPEIKIDAADFSYTAPESIPAGWVRVKLTNSGKQPHHIQFFRLNDDITFEGFQEALQKGPGAELAVSQLMGGVGTIAPAGSAQAVLNLTAGEYVIICFLPDSDHVPHLAKGMIKTLTVEEPMDAAVKEPTAELTVSMKDYLFDFPETLPAGPRIIKVINNGPDPHEFNLLRLEAGKTVEDVKQYLAAPDGPPPFLPIGGMNGLSLGGTGYIEMNFEPGTYVAICNIPTPKTKGHPHFTLGMIKQFTVV